MKQFLCIMLIACAFASQAVAQDKIKLRNGSTIEVKVKQSLDDKVEYSYPNNNGIYERPKSAISYIEYENGEIEYCDKNAIERNPTSASTSRQNTQRAVTRNANRNDDYYDEDNSYSDYNDDNQSTVYLKNGRTIKGYILRENNREIKIETDDGVITINTQNVKNVSKQYPSEQQYSNSQRSYNQPYGYTTRQNNNYYYGNRNRNNDVYYKPFYFGLRVGGNSSKMKYSGYEEVEINDDIKNCWHIYGGFAFNIKIAEFGKNNGINGGALYLQPGIYFINKGYKDKDYDKHNGRKINIGYIECPFLLSYQYNFTNKIGIYTNIGPYFSFAAYGNDKWYEYDKYDGNHSGKENIFDYEKNYYKRFDTGLSFGFGVNLSNFTIGLNYDLGLYKAYTEYYDNDYDYDYDYDYYDNKYLKNRSLNLSIGINF